MNHRMEGGKLTERFLTFLTTQLLDEGEAGSRPILLAVSGGVDSVVMADLFRTSGRQYAVAHVNFQLRGTESDEDEAFVRELAHRHKVPFHTIRVDTRRAAAEPGVSVQMAARQLRYDWFGQVADENGYGYIATAHQQDDVLETILLNLTRGTGLAGLRGIPRRQGRIIRPIWFADRAEVEAYAAEHGLRWREDSSNASDYYRRNRLRQAVLPILKEMNPGLSRTLQVTVERIMAAETLVQEELDRSWKSLVQVQNGEVLLVIDQLVGLSEWPFRLGEWLKPYGFLPGQLPAIADAVRQGFGQVFHSPDYRLLRDRDALVLQPLRAGQVEPLMLEAVPQGELPMPGGFRLRMTLFPKPDDFVIPADPRIACLDADRLDWPLLIRPWRAGDRFRPLGMKGDQAVGDFLTNRKVTLRERQSARVVVAGEVIAWLIGYRPADAFRLTARTRNVLQMEWRSDDEAHFRGF